MKIICDHKIPYISDTLATLADEVVFLPGREISSKDVKDADAIIVRTRTKCDADLLEGSNVKFVGTATIGYDHLDVDYLERRGIFWTNCPGCNARSVEQYVMECLNVLLEQHKITTSAPNNKLAVLGYGHVGNKVARAARRLGFNVVVYDPFLFPTRPIDVVYDCDIISFHTPMTKDGPFPTYHIANANFFSRLTKHPVIINSARGAVVETEALIQALDCGTVSGAVIDVWENEPDISLPLMNRCLIATPHIAGYSANGKTNADNMIVEALCRFYNKPLPPKILPPAVPYTRYNPLEDHNKLVANPAAFEEIRENYPIRLENL